MQAKVAVVLGSNESECSVGVERGEGMVSVWVARWKMKMFCVSLSTGRRLAVRECCICIAFKDIQSRGNESYRLELEAQMSSGRERGDGIAGDVVAGYTAMTVNRLCTV